MFTSPCCARCSVQASFRDDGRLSAVHTNQSVCLSSGLLHQVSRATRWLANFCFAPVSGCVCGACSGPIPRPQIHGRVLGDGTSASERHATARIAFKSCRMIGRAGARRATSLKPACANVEAVPVQMFDVLFATSVSIG